MLCVYGCGNEARFFSKCGKGQCAKSHNACPALLEKKRDAYLAKTGYPHPALNPQVKANKRRTCEERFGGPSPASSADVRAKMGATTLVRFGAVNVFSGEEGKARALRGLQAKYGDVENISQVPAVREQVKATFLERYGTREVLASPGIREKIKRTMVARYGVPWVSQVPRFFRVMQRGRWIKEEVTVDGVVFHLQGVERTVLMDLIKMGISAQDILSDPVDMPALTYFWDGKTRRYYPDFYIPKLRWVVEAKSPYTLKCEWAQNLKKREAALLSGLRFSFMVRLAHRKSSSVSKPLALR